MKVLKFGGSSVASPDRIRNIFSIVQPRIVKGEDLAIVFSAFGGVTDQLIEMIDTAEKGEDSYSEVVQSCKERHYSAIKDLFEGTYLSNELARIDVLFLKLENLLRGVHLLKEASDRSYDYVMSFGERLSNSIIASFYKTQGINTEYIDARQLITTNSDFRSAKVFKDLSYKKIEETFKNKKGTTHIITGFIASDQDGKTTTLGRGGSDYTAALFAAALDAEALEIWTDVDGVLTTNPKMVSKAYPIKQMSYIEAMEMSHFGAKVIYPPTIQPVHLKGIPTYIRNTFNPDYIGTLIHKEVVDTNGSIKGLSSLSGVSLITLSGTGLQGTPGVAARLFSCLASKNINLILITQASSEHSICLAVMEDKSKVAEQTLINEFSKEINDKLIDNIDLIHDISIIAAVGESMKDKPGIAGKLFSALGRNGVNIEAIAQGSSELNISFAVNSKDEKKALNLIHDSFFLNAEKTLNLFIVGTGLIGGTLIEQLKEFKENIRDSLGVDLKLIGLSNSRKMYFEGSGINLKGWKKDLENSAHSANPNQFVQKMIELNLANSIFVDNTASDAIPAFYETILDNSISISTPNKVASSSSYESYLNLKKIAKDRNVLFLTETNVGAGLPVLSTIQSLRNSGDKIVKIEAVLSGSLSYIFNNYSSDKNFHDLVKEAQQLGYTEPDPREDLNGSDVRRKITILAREAGYKIEKTEVKVSEILPEECVSAASTEDFFVALKANESYFNKLISDSESKSEKLRFIAKFEENNASIQLISVNEKSPFYNLSSTDNMIALYTDRYKNSPIVISGPGAGANVTAAGVFSEIIQIANERFDY